MGLDYGAYSTKREWVASANDGKGGNVDVTYWNDYSMKGKIYFHTGDKMTGANYTKDARSRSVEFLYSATNKNNVVSGQELRFGKRYNENQAGRIGRFSESRISDCRSSVFV